jgi:hypothetical protein
MGCGEWLVALFTLGSLVRVAYLLVLNGYLPAPYFYEPSDTFADWFNTAYWARDNGTYDVWSTLYPPVSFVFLRLLTLDRCYITPRSFDPSVGYDARSCDWLGLLSIAVLYIVDVYLIYRMFRRRDQVTALPRTICLGLGWPMLDGLERGNLVLAAFMFLILAVGPMLRSTAKRAVFAGLAINFKVYLIAAFVPLLLKRKWRQVEWVLIATVLVYLVSYAILGRGTIVEVVRNLVSWNNIIITQPLDLWMSTSYTPLLTLIKGDDFPTVGILGSHGQRADRGDTLAAQLGAGHDSGRLRHDLVAPGGRLDISHDQSWPDDGFDHHRGGRLFTGLFQLSGPA